MAALLSRLIRARGFEDAEDIASVLHYRVARATERPAGSGCTRKPPRLIVGLIPSADGTTGEDLRQALDERRELIETRADAMLDSVLSDAEPWNAQLGSMPDDRRKRQAWRHHARTVAAYRDRYQITGSSPLGAEPQSQTQKIDAARASIALANARGVNVDTRPERSAPRTSWTGYASPVL